MNYFFAIALGISLLFASTASVLAQGDVGWGDPDGDASWADSDGDTGGDGGGIILENPIAAGNLTDLFETIIDILLIFAIPIIVFFIIYAGFLYVTARGNESTIQKAHMALLYALVGGLLILGARVLIDVINGTVDVFR